MKKEKSKIGIIGCGGIAGAHIIYTFPSTHKEIAIKALNEGVNVFPEMPLTVSTNEAKEIVKDAGNLSVKPALPYHKHILVIGDDC